MNLLAVDGGGTKTALAVVDQDGHVLYRAAGGGINPFDQPGWAEHFQIMLNDVSEPFGAAALALPGYGEAAAVTVQQRQVAADLGVPHQVLNDVDAAQLGAFAGGPGLLILAGTGSMVWGRDADGTTLRVGGWGDLLGDEGSAYWTGLRALNGLTRALDGRSSHTALHHQLLAALQQGEEPNRDDVLPSNTVLSWLVSLTHPRSQIAGLAQQIDRWAEAGDPDAAKMLEEAAAELVLLARTAQARLPGLGAAWSVAGSFTRSATVQRALRRELGADAFRPAALPPLGGAAIAAARVAGWSVTPDWIARLSFALQERPPSSRPLVPFKENTMTTQNPTSVEASIYEQFPLWEKAPVVAPQPFDGRYVVVGCGSSYYIAQSVAATFNQHGQRAVAVAGNEWASHSGAYVTSQESLRVVAVSRSGESTETILALREAQKAGLHVIGITCEAGSTLAREADTVLYAETHPKEGVVMTASASLMLLQGLRLAGATIDGAEVAREASELLENYAPQLAEAVKGRTHFVVLGAAELHGMAQEGALKMQEMSLSFSQAYHPMEYRHGPMSLVDTQTLIVLLYHPKTADAEAKVARDMGALGARIIGIGGPGDLSIPLNSTDAAKRALLGLPLLQWLGQLVAEQKGIDSEKPRHLTKVVSLA